MIVYGPLTHPVTSPLPPSSHSNQSLPSLVSVVGTGSAPLLQSSQFSQSLTPAVGLWLLLWLAVSALPTAGVSQTGPSVQEQPPRQPVQHRHGTSLGPVATSKEKVSFREEP